MIERILIADDEPLARERVRRLVLRRDGAVSISEAASGPSTIASIRGGAPQAVFLDIEMPGCGGLDVVQAIGAARMPPTIFVTAYDEFALAAFEVAAVDYLLKPVDEQRFGAAWERLERRHASGSWAGEVRRLHALLGALVNGAGAPALRGDDAAPPPRDRFLVKDGERTIVVPFVDVVWIEASGNHVLLHATGAVYRMRDTLGNVEARLDPARFARIHRRYIVDVTAMRELRPWSGGDQVIVLRDGAKLPVSRNYRQALAARIRSGA